MILCVGPRAIVELFYSGLLNAEDLVILFGDFSRQLGDAKFVGFVSSSLEDLVCLFVARGCGENSILACRVCGSIASSMKLLSRLCFLRLFAFLLRSRIYYNRTIFVGVLVRVSLPIDSSLLLGKSALPVKFF